jgi:hypothetical protein
MMRKEVSRPRTSFRATTFVSGIRRPDQPHPGSLTLRIPPNSFIRLPERLNLQVGETFHINHLILGFVDGMDKLI